MLLDSVYILIEISFNQNVIPTEVEESFESIGILLISEKIPPLRSG